MTPRFRRGVLITLEGGEGSGKSVLAGSLADRLREESYPVLLTREPTGTDLGRTVMAAVADLAVSPEAELFLFEAARAQHVKEVLRPALERGDVVLCDRYTDSNLAYQGYGRGLNLDHIRACNHVATGGLTPHLTLLLDLPPEMGLARAQGRPKGAARGGLHERVGREPLEFHRRVRDGFLALAQREPGRIVVLDATQPPEALVRVAWERLRAFLEGIL